MIFCISVISIFQPSFNILLIVLFVGFTFSPNMHFYTNRRSYSWREGWGGDSTSSLAWRAEGVAWGASFDAGQRGDSIRESWRSARGGGCCFPFEPGILRLLHIRNMHIILYYCASSTNTGTVMYKQNISFSYSSLTKIIPHRPLRVNTVTQRTTLEKFNTVNYRKYRSSSYKYLKFNL